MSVNNSRSMNRDLSDGMTDGKYKKIKTAERGGEAEGSTDLSRKQLFAWHYDEIEAPVKLRPDGQVA